MYNYFPISDQYYQTKISKKLSETSLKEETILKTK